MIEETFSRGAVVSEVARRHELACSNCSRARI
ncbi:hypothetical protein IVB45_06010 [Bradyrhizobium sp. 4]|nr:hypothetical protein [Bradyrhizobium sp. 39]MCK1748843.1 hypothetical protein [Bradyrhizobium sp. 135]UPJ36452.1 hypothetical protein IVB45_06010 [Bradyrhizobium sp. 4]